MKPDEVSITPIRNQADDKPVTSSMANSGQKDAAINIVRSQIDNLYSKDPTHTKTNSDTNATVETTTYQRTHSDNAQINPDQWKQYHSAWQTYYQKYYEGYYLHHLNQAKKSNPSSTQGTSHYFANQPIADEEETLSKDEALFDLRQKLLTKVQTSAKKARKSHHFVPITSAIVVMLLFAFLQFNRILISNVVAYVSPGSIDPQNIVIDPNTDINVGPEAKLVIPKINVDVPVFYDVGNDYDSQMSAMKNGLAHFAIPGASSHPGQIGNTVIAGHSSNDLLDTGDYKFIFAQLDKLKAGDSIYANYNSKRYTYTVTSKVVVEPNDVDKLTYATTKPILTLVTCTPLGTSLHRLLVIAEQTSPDPSASKAAPTVSANDQASSPLPGNSPTFFERLFGAK